MRVKVSVDTASLSALDQFDTWHYLRADRNLLEANFPGDALDQLLLLRVGVAVHQDNCEARYDTLGLKGLELEPGLVDVEFFLDDVSLSIATLHDVLILLVYFMCVLWAHSTSFDFHNFFIHWCRHLNLQVKNLGA